MSIFRIFVLIITFVMLNSFQNLTSGTTALSLHSECDNPFVSDFIFMERKCSDCKQFKELSSSCSKCKSTTLGYSYICKDCHYIRSKNRANRLRPIVQANDLKIGKDEKMCHQCKTVKPKTKFNKNKARHDGVFSMCAECRRNSTVYPKSSELNIIYNKEDLDSERWVDVIIDGVKFPYKISDCGRVMINRGNKIAKPSFDQKGYPQIVLTSNKKRVGRRIHVLVGLHFIPNPHNLPELNHTKGNKLYPHYSQLEWDTSAGNMGHAVTEGLWKPFLPENSPKNKKVIDTSTGVIYPSIAIATEKTGIKHLYKKLRGWMNNDTTLKYYTV